MDNVPMSASRSVSALLASGLIAACTGTEDTMNLDKPPPQRDAGPSVRDAGVQPPRDGGPEVRDAGVPVRDAGFPVDAGLEECRDDGDCLPGGWCRETMEGGRVCVPWVTDGETCAGFVAPWSRERCDPAELACFVTNQIPDAPGNCAIPTNAQRLGSDPGRYDGRAISMERFEVIIGTVGCTARPCPSDDPCCNTCDASLEAVDERGIGQTIRITMLHRNGTPYGCSGNECNWQDQCDVEPGSYRAWGWFSFGPPPPILRVELIEAVF
jgi:hypothetical protein